MQVISIVMAFFALLGAIDYVTGNHIGVGKEFEKAIEMLGTLSLSMIGMIILAPVIGHYLYEPLQELSKVIPFEPSFVAGLLLSSDGGGAPLAMELASSLEVGYFNGLVVASMFGTMVVYTLPYAIMTTKKEQRDVLMLGMLCGISTIPVGCIVAGFMSGIAFLELLKSMLPLLLLSGILIFGLLKFTQITVKCLDVFGKFMKYVILFGFTVGVFEALTGWDVVPYTASLFVGAEAVFTVAIFLAGILPLMYLVTKLAKNPLQRLGKGLKINETSVLGLFTSLATTFPTFEMAKDMDEKGVAFNAAFSVSACFVFGDHLAYTLSFNADWALYVVVGKLLSAFASLALVAFIWHRKEKSRKGILPLQSQETENVAVCKEV